MLMFKKKTFYKKRNPFQWGPLRLTAPIQKYRVLLITRHSVFQFEQKVRNKTADSYWLQP